MRFIASALIWLLFVGGLALYIQQRDSRRVEASQGRQLEQLSAPEFALEVTATFGGEADPFALLDEDNAPAPLLIRLRGTTIYQEARPLPRGETLRIEPLHGLVEGPNELYLEAAPPLSESHLSHALRVKLLRSGAVELDRTIWSEAGSKVSGNISFDLSAIQENEHDH